MQGALHDGHLQLARRARNECDRVVTSIFVNPAQFAPTEDLDRYPRTLESDVKLLATAGADIVFAPTVREMYPAGISLHVGEQRGTFVEVKGMSHQLEGTIRPHFFRGVATVVTKLLNIVAPHATYLGQKDGQQCAVLRALVRDLHLPTAIVVCPTAREPDGLAMSSRNRYLSSEERAVAPWLYRALAAAEARFAADRAAGGRGGGCDAAVLRDIATRMLGGVQGLAVEYVSVADPVSLEEIEGVIGEGGAMMSGAVRIGKTRIIDNVLLGVPNGQTTVM
ncbi:hypothetical protein DFJ73DRAFT_823008 [Zopfochytrium polystomum]|nr:hypothetical protein DFJ73DRAFT_823008 [Zopfochytrium polystomum]